jgi:hypothetical protein
MLLWCVLAVALGQDLSPEGVVRALVTAIYKGDVAAYNAVTVPDPRRSVLTANARVNEEKLKELAEYPQGLQIKIQRDYLYQGKPAKPNASRVYPVGTTVLFMAAHSGGPMMVPLVRKSEGWRVDVRWWIAMTDLMRGSEPKPGTPELAIKTLILSMLSNDRKGASRWVAKPADLDVIFQGAPRYREPSGVLEASAMEMPLVKIGPGEFYPMPSGRIVEGVTGTDVQVLVGMFGPTEIPFVVRRAGAAWTVDPEPYFALLLR